MKSISIFIMYVLTSWTGLLLPSLSNMSFYCLDEGCLPDIDCCGKFYFITLLIYITAFSIVE